MVGLTPPLSGLQNSMAQFDQAAINFTRATEPEPPSGGQDSADLSTAAVSMVEARNSFDANSKVIQTVDNMNKAVINMVG